MQSKNLTPKHKLEGHTNDVLDFVFLHDNIHIVSGSEDGTMRKWEYDTGLLVGEPWKGEGGSIWTLALSPDGKTIGCGRRNGSVQQWSTEGAMVEDIWIGHSHAVWSLSWSPNGRHLASGSEDGTILIRRVRSGEIEVGPIEANQSGVCSLAYSPSGDRIASGGSNQTICIWDNRTGKLLSVMKDLGNSVTSLAWSLDSSKLYSASDKVARVFDSASGTLLHRLEHSHWLSCIALSSTQNVLACVGEFGVARLWDTEFHQPLGKLFRHEHFNHLDCVSFSRDGTCLAYGGEDKRVTMWSVKDIAPQLAEPPVSKAGDEESTDVDATNPFAPLGFDDTVEDLRNDPYRNFFGSSQPSPLPASPDPFYKCRPWNVFIPSTFRLPARGFIKEYLKRHFLPHRAPSNSHLQAPEHGEPIKLILEEEVTDKGEGDKGDKNVGLPDCSVPSADDGKVLADSQTPTSKNTSSPADRNENRTFWRSLIRAREKIPAGMTRVPSREIIEVYAARGFQRLIAHRRKRRMNLPALPTGAPTVAHANDFSQAVPGHGGQHLQGAGELLSQISSSRLAATYDLDDLDSDTDSSVQGTCYRFLDKLCFPRGHYH